MHKLFVCVFSLPILEVIGIFSITLHIYHGGQGRVSFAEFDVCAPFLGCARGGCSVLCCTNTGGTQQLAARARGSPQLAGSHLFCKWNCRLLALSLLACHSPNEYTRTRHTHTQTESQLPLLSFALENFLPRKYLYMCKTWAHWFSFDLGQIYTLRQTLIS